MISKNKEEQERFEMRKTLIDTFCIFEKNLERINKEIEELQSGVNVD